MSFKVFENEMPDVCSLAYHAEYILEFDHILALNHLKEIGRLIVKKILLNENVEIDDSEPFINLSALMEIEILPFSMVTTLKKLEYLDTRESFIFIEKNKVRTLILEIFDLTAWYYKTFVNDQFVPPPLLLEPQIGTVVTQSEHETKPNLIKSVIHIDNKRVEGVWESVKENQICIEYESGETYLGQMMNGLKCGTGVYRWSDGSKYEGQWFNDKEYGFGVKEYANGDFYRGEWKDGLYDGNGIYKWNDGTVYEGGWVDNLEHGYGTKIHRDGYVQKGFWTRGELVFNKDQLNQRKPLITD
ncbi:MULTISPECIES: MORN repeat-containing protein [Paenibacillus]|uniref:MORN repeat-containing protein n=1 Tax=Paenibacillus urinalis TaxID=521520 RepID=A0AAX3N6R1_9BACL|nr:MULTISPECIES: hypothetical protein [Paenibacillus]MCM3131128.1 hypothetical protein [Paenibacillus sp. MER 78]WDH85332.1 hypothetical protein PUW23_26215 [Paenibacillus urinalis]WDI05295.1 hypothetical protein PUW25_27130 [Paenibacillus urinalis]